MGGLGRGVGRQFGCLLMLSMTVVCLDVRADQSVSLAWDPSPDTNVVGYAVYYGSASGAYDSRLDVGTNTLATVAGLLKGLTYFFVVTAYDADGLESEPSNEVSFDVPGFADIGISMTALPTWVGLGANVIFTISVTNAGPDAAGTVIVTNVLPAGLSFVDATTPQGAVTIADNLVILGLGPVYSGEVVAPTVTAVSTSSGWLTSSASVTTLTSETNLGNNVTFAPILVSPIRAPSLRVSMGSGGTILLSWDATTGQDYQVQYKTDLTETNWINLGSVVTATNSSVTVSWVIGPDPRRFYRVVTQP
jgi:uncharacterized repeat protein (TIGR01451 family)